MITHDKWNKILGTLTLIIGIIVSIESFFGLFAYPPLWIGYGILVLMSLWFIFRKAQVQKPLASQEPTLPPPPYGQVSNKAGGVAESEIREQNLKLIKYVIKGIETRYQNELKQLAPILDKKFTEYQFPDTDDNKLGICAYSHIKSSDGNGFHIAFWLNYGSLNESTTSTGKKSINSYIDEASGACNKAWFESNLKPIFPDAKFKEGTSKQRLRSLQTLSPQTSREELENTFKTTVFEILDKLLPKLVQLHNDGIL